MGDAAILQGEIRALRTVFGADAEIEVSEQTPTVAQRLYPDIRFHAGLHAQHAHWPRWRSHGGVASLRKRRTSLAVRLLSTSPFLARLLLSREQRAHLDRLAAADVVVATGGTYFVEHYNFTAKADELLAAQALGRPTFLFTQSMGPFTRPKSQLTMQRIAAGSRGVFLRDAKSKGHLTALAADATKLHVHADAAFALATPEAPRPPRAAGAPRARVAISVRQWSHFKQGSGDDAGTRYRRAVADAARTLAREGVEVTFLSTCQGVPEYWTDDSRFAAQLVAELLPGEPNIHVDTSFRTPEQLVGAARFRCGDRDADALRHPRARRRHAGRRDRVRVQVARTAPRDGARGVGVRHRGGVVGGAPARDARSVGRRRRAAGGDRRAGRRVSR